jgi:two-component system sensor histidine kinase EvgS
MKLSHNVLLALAYVSQISDPDLIRTQFIAALNGLDDNYEFEYFTEEPATAEALCIFKIATTRYSFGYVLLSEDSKCSDEEKAVFRNAFQFLAIIIENRIQSLELLAKNALLLHESEEKFRHVFEAANVGKSITSLSGNIDVNQAFCDFLGYAPEELREKTWQELTPPEDIVSQEAILMPLLHGETNSTRFEKRYIHKNGSLIWADVSVAIQRDADGTPLKFITTVVDITDRKKAEMEKARLESNLVQAQKMDAVGKLAGGVAHDFNNVLGVVIGYTEMAMEKVDKQDPLYADLEEIFNAAQRSADITRQLLAFARKQIAVPKTLDLNKAIPGIHNLLKKLIGEDIKLTWLPLPGLWSVRLDPSQLDQILANLCINARDAISGVGEIVIETGNRSFDAEYCNKYVDFLPGEYILLSVSDSGCGMDKDTMQNLFEPFFTTKGIGHGTGLGLATVYGIVNQNNGFINVHSEPGKGTTFNIYLPRYTGEIQEKTSAGVTDVILGVGETVLLVEDEVAILQMAGKVLRDYGYDVIAVNSAGEALELAEEHAGKIRLLITDVILPELNGRQLSEKIRTTNPKVKTLFMSGYTANVIAHRGILDEDVDFIQKPFSVKEFAAKVRLILDRVEPHQG